MEVEGILMLEFEENPPGMHKTIMEIGIHFCWEFQQHSEWHNQRIVVEILHNSPHGISSSSVINRQCSALPRFKEIKQPSTMYNLLSSESRVAKPNFSILKCSAGYQESMPGNPSKRHSSCLRQLLLLEVSTIFWTKSLCISLTTKKIEMVSQIYLDHEMCTGPENTGNKDGDSSVLPSSEDDAAASPTPMKKATRTWAAWTHPEEERFFAALRQIGKDFRKITCHVQSKNRNQVRHYYYRLVKRMNKILCPELRLDAKNSKDTNAAMLQWWSLLEKYNCKASKLHLKPRKFKLFTEALENQLLKDRKKNIKKQRATGENKSAVHSPVSSQVTAPNHGSHEARGILADRQNTKRVGTGKRSSRERRVNTGTKSNNSEAESTTAKATKRSQKTGHISTAKYIRLEMEAIAGISLVADAAEYMEQGETNKEIEHIQERPGQGCCQDVARGDTNNDTEHVQEAPGLDRSPDVARGVHYIPILPQSTINSHGIHNCGKMKLQLFPMDECTQRALEMDHHNPHLELTLSTRKKISSVLKHLNCKWGNASLLSQELMLFPYWAQRENLLGYQKWTKDSLLCVEDIYNLVGSPTIFRLRYGWFSKAEVETAMSRPTVYDNRNEKNMNSSIEERNIETESPSGGPCSNEIVSTEQTTDLTPSSGCTLINSMESGVSISNINVEKYHDNPAVASSPGTQHEASAVTKYFETKDMTILVGDWADSITTISVEDLLSESTNETDIIFTEFPVPGVSNSLEQAAFSCDSFDAAIAAHLCRLQNKSDLEQRVASHELSPFIWDDDETCDAFSFQKNRTVHDSIETCKKTTTPSSFPPHNEIEVFPDQDKLKNSKPDHGPDNSNKDSDGLTNIYCPDSLGLLDLGIPFCEYNRNNTDEVHSDRHDGLNRLLAESLDAFQSIFGLDRKEPASTAEDQSPH